MTQFGRTNYISTYGCPYTCSFCASNGKLSKKGVREVVDDLETLAKEGFTEISIQDNYFGYSPKRIKEICEEILSREIKISWDCQTRVESMQDEGLLELMFEAGCDAIYIGTENFDMRILEKMRKTRNPEIYLDMTKKAINNMKRVGIKPYVNVQVGLSEENEEVRENNVKALRELKVDVFFHLNVVYPGTSDFYNLVNDGVPEDIFETFTRWEEENNDKIKKLLQENGLIHGVGGIPLAILDYESLKKKEFVIKVEEVNQVNEYLRRFK